MPGAADECERLVRAQDPDRAVAVLFAPSDRRRHLLALYAFNVETARVRDQISQPLPGEIRLQWWRDQIEAAAETQPNGDHANAEGNPVAAALIAAMGEFALPLSAFQLFLETRVFDLYDDPMPSRGDFEAYAGGTASTLIMLAAMILDGSKASQASDAAGHAGVAQAAVGALRLLPQHRRRGQVFFPADLLSAVGCSREALLSGDPEPTERAIAAMTAFARSHFLAYRAARPQVPADLRAAFLPVAAAAIHLARIEARGMAEIETPTRIGPFARSWTYWRDMRA